MLLSRKAGLSSYYQVQLCCLFLKHCIPLLPQEHWSISLPKDYENSAFLLTCSLHPVLVWFGSCEIICTKRFLMKLNPLFCPFGQGCSQQQGAGVLCTWAQGAAQPPLGFSTAASLSQLEPASTCNIVHQFMLLPTWSTSSSAHEYLLLLDEICNRPRSVRGSHSIHVMESWCGKHGEPCSCLQGRMAVEHQAPHLGVLQVPRQEGQWAAVLVGLTCVRDVTATLQEQDSNSSPPSETPQTPLTDVCSTLTHSLWLHQC